MSNSPEMDRHMAKMLADFRTGATAALDQMHAGLRDAAAGLDATKEPRKAERPGLLPWRLAPYCSVLMGLLCVFLSWMVATRDGDAAWALGFAGIAAANFAAAAFLAWEHARD